MTVGDDRGGSAESGETILVNPAGASNIKRIIVYTFIYEGAAQWAQTDAVFLHKASLAPVEIDFDFAGECFCLFKVDAVLVTGFS